MEVKYFDSDVVDFVGSLEMQTRAKVVRMIDALELYGHMMGLPQSRSLGRGLFELRAHGRQEVRLFYTFHKGSAYILYGFVKKSLQTPRHEIEVANRKKLQLDAI